MTALPRPFALLAELTYRCPLKCPYCSNPLQLARIGSELATDVWKRVLGEARDLGAVQIHFSGGEPLLRADLAELVATTRRLDLYSNLSTSAATATRERLAELRDAGLDALQVSLLDADPQANDLLAGTMSFDKKRAAVEEGRRLGFPITLNVVLHRRNLDRLARIIDLAAEWQVDRLELAHVQYVGWAYRNRSALLPTSEQVAKAAAIVATANQRYAGRLAILHVLPDYFQRDPKACLQGWGQAFLTVAPDGVVLPCQAAREIPALDFPNVASRSLHDIWFHDPVFQRFRGSAWLPEPCRSCDRREIDFGGCRCQAFLVTGQIDVADPVCRLSPHRPLIDRALEDADNESPPLVYRSIERRARS